MRGYPGRERHAPVASLKGVQLLPYTKEGITVFTKSPHVSITVTYP